MSALLTLAARVAPRLGVRVAPRVFGAMAAAMSRGMPSRLIIEENRAFFGLPTGRSRHVLRHFGRYLGEFFAAGGDPSLVKTLLGSVNYSAVEAARASGRGIAVVTPHFGNWEFGALALGYLHPDAQVLIRTTGHPALDATIRACRGAHRTLDVADGVRPIEEALKSGGVVAAAIDEPRDRGLPVNFLGRRIAFPHAFFRVVAKANALVVPTLCRRNASGLIDILATEPVDDSSPEKTAQAVADIFSSWIRADPDQWVLMKSFVQRRVSNQPQSGE